MATPTVDFWLRGDADGYKAAEKEVRTWTKRTEKQLLFELARLGVKDRSDARAARSSRVRFAKVSSTKVKVVREEQLEKSIRSGVRKRGVLVESAWISFARQGILIQHGVGKYRPAYSREAKMAAKPWLTNVLPDAVDALAFAISEYYADIIAGELRLRIPGIFDTRIKVGT